MPEADTLVAPLLRRIEGAEGASSSKLESKSEGILYHLSSSSSSSLLESVCQISRVE